MEALSFLVSCVGAIGGFLWLRDRWVVRVRERSFYRLFPIDREVLIVCATRNDLVATPNLPTTVEDSLALAAIQVAFVRHGVPHRVKVHSGITAEDRTNNLFLVAGPGSNGVAADLLKLVRLPFAFEKDGGFRIVDRQGHQMHPNCDGSDIDHAILAVFRNPWSTQARRTNIYLAAGIEGLGTWGAASFIAESSGQLRRILEAHEIDDREGFEVLLNVASASPHAPNCSVLRATAFLP